MGLEVGEVVGRPLQWFGTVLRVFQAKNDPVTKLWDFL